MECRAFFKGCLDAVGIFSARSLEMFLKASRLPYGTGPGTGLPPDHLPEPQGQPPAFLSPERLVLPVGGGELVPREVGCLCVLPMQESRCDHCVPAPGLCPLHTCSEHTHMCDLGDLIKIRSDQSLSRVRLFATP